MKNPEELLAPKEEPIETDETESDEPMIELVTEEGDSPTADETTQTDGDSEPPEEPTEETGPSEPPEQDSVSAVETDTVTEPDEDDEPSAPGEEDDGTTSLVSEAIEPPDQDGPEDDPASASEEDESAAERQETAEPPVSSEEDITSVADVEVVTEPDEDSEPPAPVEGDGEPSRSVEEQTETEAHAHDEPASETDEATEPSSVSEEDSVPADVDTVIEPDADAEPPASVEEVDAPTAAAEDAEADGEPASEADETTERPSASEEESVSVDDVDAATEPDADAEPPASTEGVDAPTAPADDAKADGEPASEADETTEQPGASEEESVPADVDAEEDSEPSGVIEEDAEAEVPTDETLESEPIPVEAVFEEPDLLDIVPEPMVITGTVAGVFDFVAGFDQANHENALSISTNTAETVGTLTHPAIFQHPQSQGVSRLDYSVPFPEVAEGERLILCFSISLREGIPDDGIEHDGVRFAVDVGGERVFSGFSNESVWQEQILDVTRFASQELRVAWKTDAGEEGDSSYDWALWGDPRLLLVRHIENNPITEFTQGWLLAQPDDEEGSLGGLEFDFIDPQPLDIITENAVHEFSERWEKPVGAIAVFSYEPELQLTHLGPTTAVVSAGMDFYVRCVVRNTGRVTVVPDQKTSVTLEGVRLSRDRTEKNIGQLRPGEEHLLRWHVRSFSRERDVTVSATLKHRLKNNNSSQNLKATFSIERAAPQLSPKVNRELGCLYEDDHLVIENGYLRAVFARGRRDVGYYQLFAARGDQYHLVATAAPFAAFGYLSAEGECVDIPLRPTQWRVSGSSDSDAVLTLEANYTDPQDGHWQFEATFRLEPRSRYLRTEFRLQVDADRQLVYFHGPTLHVGDQTFGAHKNFALFPGLEYLEGEEPSSNPRDARPPAHLRLVPHPYKVTLPLMVVENESTLIGMLWDPMQQWDGLHTGLSAQFASPNWHEHQDNHLMRLFVPTVPDWVAENADRAAKPYAMAAGNPVRIDAQILLDGSAHVLDSVRYWTNIHGTVEPLAVPRDDEAQIKLSRHAFMETVWDAETKQSRHCVDWASGHAPGFATLLWHDYLATGDEEVHERVHLIKQQILDEVGPKGLAAPTNCHILRWEFPFYQGYLAETVEAMQESVAGVLSQQQADGSWVFQPGDEKTATLGESGDVVIGTCAYNAWLVLKYARISGEESAFQAGLRALRFMKRFKVPRGAQAWECPLYEPDILAAGHAIGAYVEAYRITGDKRNLHQAEYWARTGLPFLYHWNLPDRPAMRYASIPVFGTTFYTHSWLGVPVQWNGLVYAYHLQHMAEYLQGSYWRKAAEGILVSAMHQQWPEGELKGTYPDGLYGYCTDGRGPHINPENIMVNLFTLRGADPDIKTRILQTNQGRIHISSGAGVDHAQIQAGRLLVFELSYAAGQFSHTLVTGVDTPGSVLVNGVPLGMGLQEGQGWDYLTDRRMLVLRALHTTEPLKVELQPPVPVSEEEPIAVPFDDVSQE